MSSARKRQRRSTSPVASYTPTALDPDRDADEIFRQLAERGYAGIRLPRGAAASVKRLVVPAHHFFLDRPLAERRSCQTLRAEEGGGTSMYGYAEPSPFKMLFRYRGGEEHSQHMRWPEPAAAGGGDALESSLRESVETAAVELDAVLTKVIDQVLARCAGGSSVGGGSADGGGDNEGGVAAAPPPLTVSRLVAVAQGTEQPAPRREADGPLDLFYYYNRSASDDQQDELSNCTPHIDRGLMHLIVTSDVPGLVVRDAATRHWTEAEAKPQAETKAEAQHGGDAESLRGASNASDESNAGESSDVMSMVPWASALVMVNGHLQQLTEEAAAMGDASGGHGVTPMPACVHAVRRGEAPRLSISYELRLPRAGGQADAKLASEFLIAQHA